LFKLASTYSRKSLWSQIHFILLEFQSPSKNTRQRNQSVWSKKYEHWSTFSGGWKGDYSMEALFGNRTRKWIQHWFLCSYCNTDFEESIQTSNSIEENLKWHPKPWWDKEMDSLLAKMKFWKRRKNRTPYARKCFNQSKMNAIEQSRRRDSNHSKSSAQVHRILSKISTKG